MLDCRAPALIEHRLRAVASVREEFDLPFERASRRHALTRLVMRARRESPALVLRSVPPSPPLCRASPTVFVVAPFLFARPAGRAHLSVIANDPAGRPRAPRVPRSNDSLAKPAVRRDRLPPRTEAPPFFVVLLPRPVRVRNGGATRPSSLVFDSQCH